MARVQIFWDASGFVKRYFGEAGQAAVNAVFAAVPMRDMHITPWGYAETYSILLRRYNAGILGPNAFRDAITELQMDVIGASGLRVLSISDATIFGSPPLMQAHNINAADAAILATYLRFQRAAPAPCLMVASDKRLNRAAEAEGLKSLNPEEITPGEVPQIVL